MEKTADETEEEIKKMSLVEILEYAKARGMNGEALTKLERTYDGLLEDKR